jgi:hypothetical protein
VERGLIRVVGVVIVSVRVAVVVVAVIVVRNDVRTSLVNVAKGVDILERLR